MSICRRKLGLRPDGRLIVETLRREDGAGRAEGHRRLHAVDPGRRRQGHDRSRPTSRASRRSRAWSGRPRPPRADGAQRQGRPAGRLAGHARRSSRFEGVPPGLLRETIKLSGGAACRRDQAWRLDKVRDGEPGLHLRDVGQRPPAHGRDRHDRWRCRGSACCRRMSAARHRPRARCVLTPTGGDLQFTVDLTDLSRGGIASKQAGAGARHHAATARR